ncbi:hypothetical protein FQZ97_1248760 [compost metagenome]
MGAGSLFAAVQIQIAKVLLLDGRIGAIVVQRLDTFVQQGLELGVAFGQAHGGFGWQ